MIVELDDDIEQNNIQGSLLFGQFSNLLRNYNLFTSLLRHRSAKPADYESGGREFESLRARQQFQILSMCPNCSRRDTSSGICVVKFLFAI